MPMFCLLYRIVTILLEQHANVSVIPRSIPDLDDLENYVFEHNGGHGIFIYHVERVSFR